MGAEKVFFSSAINLERELLTKLQIYSAALKSFCSFEDFQVIAFFFFFLSVNIPFSL